jgi:hypothetical protein
VGVDALGVGAVIEPSTFAGGAWTVLGVFALDTGLDGPVTLFVASGVDGGDVFVLGCVWDPGEEGVHPAKIMASASDKIDTILDLMELKNNGD